MDIFGFKIITLIHERTVHFDIATINHHNPLITQNGSGSMRAYESPPMRFHIELPEPSSIIKSKYPSHSLHDNPLTEPKPFVNNKINRVGYRTPLLLSYAWGSCLRAGFRSGYQ